MTLFLRVVDAPALDKGEALRQAVKGDVKRLFEVQPSEFALVPGSPFAYTASARVRSIFTNFTPFETHGRTVKQGLATTNDFRFIRSWWETPAANMHTKWFPFAKGGSFAPFYADISLCLNWSFNGAQSWAIYEARRDAVGGIIKNPDFYFRPGLTWPIKNRFSFKPRVLPAGCIFAHIGPSAFIANDVSRELLALQAVMSSETFTALARVMAGWNFEVGVIQRTPVPALEPRDREILSDLSLKAWSCKRTLDTANEISHAFLLPSALRTRLGPFKPLDIEVELAAIQSAIDDIVFRAYGLHDSDRETIELLGKKAARPAGEADESISLSQDSIADDDQGEGADLLDAYMTLQSWSVGVAFGRFDLRLATGERQAPPEPEPFDPLPTRSPGMVPETDVAQFPVRTILVDDLGHALDLAAQAAGVLERVGFPPEDPETLRRWLARDFFPLHIKMYSKSRRKAPIYWQLATPSASYSAWLYIHALSRDTLYTVQEIASTKLVHDERKLESLGADLGPNPKAAERKALAAQETFVEELHTFLEEVKRVTPLWNPVLDDGVIINFAPLWRLVPHHKPWQKELKATWDALCEGKYEWAHLAMHLWPERVVPKCATDRSLAIAHGLEEVFWEKDEEGRWKPRSTPTRPMEELVRERTSSVVKVALKGLLEAPLAMANGGGRGRRGRRRKNTGEAV